MPAFQKGDELIVEVTGTHDHKPSFRIRHEVSEWRGVIASSIGEGPKPSTLEHGQRVLVRVTKVGSRTRSLRTRSLQLIK